MKALVLLALVSLVSSLSFARTFSPEFRRSFQPQGIERLCEQYKYRNSNRSCFMDFNGEERGLCEFCAEGKSCFMAFNGEARNFCEAYAENKSCFMAFNGTDRAWCEVIKEGKSCFMAFNGRDRALCESGRYPRNHLFWLR